MSAMGRNLVLPAAVLLMFSIGALTQSSATQRGPVFNIMDYGARNDGSASATEAFRAAILAAKRAGGGTVFVPAGKYKSQARSRW